MDDDLCWSQATKKQYDRGVRDKEEQGGWKKQKDGILKSQGLKEDGGACNPLINEEDGVVSTSVKNMKERGGSLKDRGVREGEYDTRKCKA